MHSEDKRAHIQPGGRPLNQIVSPPSRYLGSPLSVQGLFWEEGNEGLWGTSVAAALFSFWETDPLVRDDSHYQVGSVAVSLQYIGVNTFLYTMGNADRFVMFTHIHLSFIFGYWMMDRLSRPLGAKCSHVILFILYSD